MAERGPRTWKCQAVRAGVKCGHDNPKLKQLCEVDGCRGRRPKASRPAHMAVMDRVTYEDLVAVMGERCWICGQPRDPAKNRLHREHAHAGDGVMRGLACWPCNDRLPDRVTPEWLRAAAVYMERGDWQHPDWDGPLLGIPRDELVNVGEASVLLDGMTRKNVGKWLERHGVPIVRVDEHPNGHPLSGRLYLRTDVQAAAERWLAVRNRDSDRKRRAAALANLK